MSKDPTRMVHVPLSQHTVKELQARALELQRIALSASNTADMRALVALAGRFQVLAERRENVARGAAEALAPRPADVEWFEAGKRTVMLGSDRPMGLPSVEAMQIAADALSRQYLLPETMHHPAIQSATKRLAYTLMAYGLAATGPEPAAARSEIAIQQSSAGRLDRPRDTGHHILVVDDVSDVLVAVGAFLMKEAFVIQHAANGDEALRLIASDPRIGILITDFAMPGLNGVELIAQATRMRPNLKALVITGYPNADGLAELPPHTTILVKPFRRDTLIAGVRSLLGEMRPLPDETAELIDSRDLESAGLMARRQV
jgi:CheY-like chemotaxis protein